MPVPKRKRSKARRDKRFANKGMNVASITQCLNCKSPLNTHNACKECGFYKGVKVMTTKADRIVARAGKRQAKQAKAQPARDE
jgi:large subunit ribosomal protein L32